jgi:hypothetical protein
MLDEEVAALRAIMMMHMAITKYCFRHLPLLNFTATVAIPLEAYPTLSWYVIVLGQNRIWAGMIQTRCAGLSSGM